MITESDCNLLLSLQILSIKKSLPLLKKCHLQIEPINNTLVVIACNEAIASLLKWQQELIATLAYLKLGCSEISFYLDKKHLWIYNSKIDVFAAIDNIIVPMLTAERETQTQSPTQQSNWASFEAIAQLMSQELGWEITATDIEDSAEQFSIPSLRKDGVWGLDKKSLPQFIEKYFVEFKNKLVAKIVPGTKTRNTRGTTKSSGNRRKPAAVADNVRPINAAANAVPTDTPTIPQSVEGEMVLPLNFGEILMQGRTRKPNISQGLTMALETLPGGAKDGENYAQYLESIALNRVQSRNFIKDLGQHFTSSSRNYNKAIAEIKNAALALIDSQNAA